MAAVAPIEAGKATVGTKRTGFLNTINRAINGTLERIFESLGRLIAARPVLVIIGALCSLL